ncbi:MAG TPA: TetR/AcrR family transcriptional regulator [Gemmatimonadales bacterium]|nr:TetR/AcrR family transcriptional regulator [Gemmatimonadales bacterium]
MDDSSSKDQILDAAQSLFAAQGFSATTVKQIARSAGVNSALLYYYFEDKERLYRAVLERLVARLIGRTMTALQTQTSPPERIRGFVNAQVEIFMSIPDLPRLFMREMLDHDAAHAVEQISHLAATSFKGLCDTIAQGQKQGTFRADLDPKLAAISTVGQVVYFFLARPALRIFLETGKDIPKETALKFAQHASDFALAALSSGTGSSASSPKGRKS